MIGAFDDLDVHALENGRQRILDLRPVISAIGVQLRKERAEAEHCRHQERAAVAVLNVGAIRDGAGGCGRGERDFPSSTSAAAPKESGRLP